MRHAPRVLRMAVIRQSNVKFGRKRVFLVGTTNFIAGIAFAIHVLHLEKVVQIVLSSKGCSTYTVFYSTSNSRP